MQPMWLCMHWSKCIEDTFDNAQWRKAKQLPPMWLCLFSGRRFEETQWGKAKKCNQCNYASSEASELRRHLITYTGETKIIASSVFRIHLRTVIHKSATLGKSHTNAFLGMIFPTISPHTRSSTVVINILNVVSVTLCHLSQVISMSPCLFTQERNLWSV